MQFEAGLARGEGALSPAMLVASDAKGDYAFLNLKGPAFDLSDRGVAGRAVPAGLDAFVYTERGVYRSGETVHITALLRDAQGVAAPDVPLTLVVERPDGVEYRRVAVRRPGRRRRIRSSVPINVGGLDRHLAGARLHRSEAPGGRRDHLPGRGLCAGSARVRSRGAGGQHRRATRRPRSRVDGRYLYGAPASELDLEGEVRDRARPRSGPGFAGYQFGLADEDVETVAPAARRPAADRRQGQGELRRHARQAAGRPRVRSRRR